MTTLNKNNNNNNNNQDLQTRSLPHKNRKHKKLIAKKIMYSYGTVGDD